jgi:hypothetical protein
MREEGMILWGEKEKKWCAHIYRRKESGDSEFEYE